MTEMMEKIKNQLEEAGLVFGEHFNEETLEELVDGKGEEYHGVQ